MRILLILAMTALAVEAQLRPGPRRGPPQRKQFQGPPRGGPPFRGPPPPPPPGFRGPPPPPPPGFRPQGGPPSGGRPDQVLSLGQLPLNPRPEFNNPSFFGPQEEHFDGEEVQFDGPLFADDVEGLRPNRERFEDESTPFIDTPPTSDFSQDPSHVETSAPETHAPPPPPRQQLEDSEQFEQETQEVVDVLSSPPQRRPFPSSVRPRPSRPQRFPTHPNQLPLHNVIEDEARAETRQRPPHDRLVEYEYDDEEEDEEEEEPDRLSILLQNSHFSCVSKKNGYYADEEVDCEVFHYCQENVKHSWLCPEGASFHQVHLICMPRSEDNICAKSSKFHFVNDFLYKEVDGENKTYADRYYPEGFEDGVAKLDEGAPQVSNPPPHRNAPAHFEPFESFEEPISHPPRRPSEAFLDRPPQSQPEIFPQQQFHPIQDHPGRPFVDRRPGQFARPPPRPIGPQLGFQG